MRLRNIEGGGVVKEIIKVIKRNEGKKNIIKMWILE